MMNKYQQQVDKWITDQDIGYWEPLAVIARLTEETGELARVVNDRFGAKSKKETEDKQELEEEMADIIFTLACLANSLDLDLDRGFKKVMDKCYSRDENRWKEDESKD